MSSVCRNQLHSARKREQAEKGFDGLTYFFYRTLLDAEIDGTEEVRRKIKQAFLRSQPRQALEEPYAAPFGRV